MHCYNSRIGQNTPHAVPNSNILYCSQVNQSLGLVLYKHDSETWCIYVTLVGEGGPFWCSLDCICKTDDNNSKCYI